MQTRRERESPHSRAINTKRLTSLSRVRRLANLECLRFSLAACRACSGRSARRSPKWSRRESRTSAGAAPGNPQLTVRGHHPATFWWSMRAYRRAVADLNPAAAFSWGGLKAKGNDHSLVWQSFKCQISSAAPNLDRWIDRARGWCGPACSASSVRGLQENVTVGPKW